MPPEPRGKSQAGLPEIFSKKHVDLIRQKGFQKISDSSVDNAKRSLKIFLLPRRTYHTRLVGRDGKGGTGKVSFAEFFNQLFNSLINAKGLVPRRERGFIKSDESLEKIFEKAGEAVRDLKDQTERREVSFQTIDSVLKFWDCLWKTRGGEMVFLPRVQGDGLADSEELLSHFLERVTDTVKNPPLIGDPQTFVERHRVRELAFQMQLLREWRAKLQNMLSEMLKP